MVQLAAQHGVFVTHRERWALGAWAGLIALGAMIGASLNAAHWHIVLSAPPILADFVDRPRFGIVLPIAVAAAMIRWLPGLTSRLSWRKLLVVVATAAACWTLALSLAEGTSGLTRGPSWHTEYLTDVPAVRADPAAFLRGFTTNIARYEVHVRGHPPGMVLLLAGLDHIGLTGAGGEAALVITLASTAPVAVMLVLRQVAGEQSARLAGTWLVLTPAAIWIATSADALYMTIGAWAIACVVLASTRRWIAGVALAVGGGILGALTLLGSYGLVLLAVVPISVLWSRRREAAVRRTVIVSAATVVGLLVAMLPLGYSWIAGLRATKHEYFVLDLNRPYWAFIFINPAAWALALGPATFMGLSLLRDRRLWTLVGGAIAAAALANLSGLSSGEVERIWLPFTIWVLPAAVALSAARSSARLGLILQATSAIALISIVTTQW